MDLSGLLTQGLSSPVDPSSLHAELWADYVSKVTTTWLPLLMATALVGRDLFGSGTKCFPVDLTETPSDRDETGADNITYTQDSSFHGDISDYTRQLAEYVDVYCAKQNHYKGSAMFSYQLFTMMLVIQAGVLYAPILLWNITTARKVICNLRFLIHDTDLLYHRHRGDQALTIGGYEQSELVKNVNIWSKRTTLYKRYMIKQLATAACSVMFITVYSTTPLTASNIHDEFRCSVKDKFTVDCAVPSATVYRCIWGVNMAMLCVNVSSIVGHIVSLQYDHYYGGRQPFRELGITLNKPKDCPLNDGHLIYTFLLANMESIDKYNYVRVLKDVVSEEPPPIDPQAPAPINPAFPLLDYVSTL